MHSTHVIYWWLIFMLEDFFVIYTRLCLYKQTWIQISNLKDLRWPVQNQAIPNHCVYAQIEIYTVYNTVYIYCPF